MILVANRRIRVVPNVVTYIARQLPGKGKLLIQVGQHVTPPDLIGHSFVSAGFRTFNIAKALGVSPKQAFKYSQRNLGQTIYRGELLALKPAGFLSPQKIVTAPTDGKLESYDETTGDVRFSFLPKQKDLPAAVYGIVEKIDEIKGEVIIKTQVTQIYGLFGTGKSREGILHMLGDRGDLFDTTRIKDEMAEQIVVGGGLAYSDAIAQAVASRVGGIITGGINAKDYRSMAGGRLSFPNRYGTDIGIGLLVCEGFGSIPIGDDIFNVLLQYKNRFAILEGNRGRLLLPTCEADCMVKIKNTQLPDMGTVMVDPLTDVEAETIQIGQQVRIIGAPFMGDQGQVVAVDNRPTLMPSEILAYMVTIQTRSRKIKVPFSNIEIIGSTLPNHI